MDQHLNRRSSDGATRYVTVPEFVAAIARPGGANVTFDPNVIPVYEGTYVYARQGTGILQIECRLQINFLAGYTVVQVPDGYRPARRQWVILRALASGVSYLFVLRPDGWLISQDAPPATTELLGSIAYPLA